VLRESGLTYNRPSGTSTLLSLRHEDLETRFPGLLSSVLHAYGTSYNPPQDAQQQDEDILYVGKDQQNIGQVQQNKDGASNA
jgi:hypothetical protein